MSIKNLDGLPEHVCPHLARKFNFSVNPAMNDDPWREFHKLNEEPDIFWSTEQEGYWVITRAAIVEEVLLNPEVFSSAINSIPRMQDDMRLIPPNIDPPEHIHYRRIITNKIFSSPAVDSIGGDARTFLRELIDQAADKGEGDLIAMVTRPFPIGVFLKLMGMPGEKLDEFSDTIDVFFRGQNIEDVTAARQEVFGFAQSWLQSNPDDEGAHMLRELKAAEVDGRPISEEELTIMVLTLFFAGLDTVTAVMSFMGHFLATHPEQQTRLRQTPGDIPNAVEEMLRRFGIANLCRELTQDFELHGVQMKKADLVMVSSAMGGVDKAAYENPLEVDFDRPNVRRHSAFGKGIHMCAGARLARTELVMLWEELLPRFKNFRLAPDADIRFLTGTIMSMEKLPVVWDLD